MISTDNLIKFTIACSLTLISMASSAKDNPPGFLTPGMIGNSGDISSQSRTELRNVEIGDGSVINVSSILALQNEGRLDQEVVTHLLNSEIGEGNYVSLATICAALNSGVIDQQAFVLLDSVRTGDDVTLRVGAIETGPSSVCENV